MAMNLLRAAQHFRRNIKRVHTLEAPRKAVRHAARSAAEFEHRAPARRQPATRKRRRHKSLKVLLARREKRLTIPIAAPRRNVMKSILPGEEDFQRLVTPALAR